MTDEARARMIEGARLGRERAAATKAAERAAGLEFARRWRREQPAKAMLDAIYGAEG